MRNQLIAIFDGVKDPRKIDKRTYELRDLMAIALLTYLTGKKDYADMSLFAEYSARKFGLLPYILRFEQKKNTENQVISAFFCVLPLC